jgi:hypothetical protein
MYSDSSYRQWLRTLDPERVRKEAEVISQMLKTPMTDISKSIVKLKMNVIKNL